MKVGDLVRIRQRYSSWGCEKGIYIGACPSKTLFLCRVLFGETILIFHKHELEATNEGG